MEAPKLKNIHHTSYFNKATFKLDDTKLVYAMLLKELIAIHGATISKNGIIIVIALKYDLQEHRYGVLSMLFDTMNMPAVDFTGLTDMKILTGEPNEILIFYELLDANYFQNLQRELSIIKFYEANSRNSLPEFMANPTDKLLTLMKSHFDVAIEDAIREEPKYTNAVSIELTFNASMVEAIAKMGRDSTNTKKLACEFYQAELLALVLEMIDNIAMTRD